MEVCVPCITSAGRDVISNCGSPTDPLNPTHYGSKDLSLVDLETRLTRYLNIDDVEFSNSESYSSLKKNGTVNVVREDGSENSDESKLINSTALPCFSKCSSSPPLDEPKSSFDGLSGGKKMQAGDKTVEACDINGCAESVNQCSSQPMSLPTSSKRVSAMKGSREKNGMAPKKLSVTWAPDVYDPIPTSVSHVPSSKNQRYRSGSKKYGKSKQKSSSAKSSRGKTKDKKQPRKSSGSTTKIRPLYNDGGVLGFGDAQTSILDFNVLQSQTHFAEVVF